ncbi:hypothetical protein O181_031741 [Austropuccinia psidii MF-1]|uniref:CCHC-type domain-containing protein n=1 Tax=Austropuccinia psidii MF-1 TaxID=1389203 RepID=A0A9Q3H5H4_9BASI|nr:hypothetical protein [Austropuccinia psidii MF-1]
MSVSTHSKKAADNDADAKPLSNKEVYSLINSLRSKVQSLKLACSSDADEVQSLCMQLSSPPPPGGSFQPLLCISTSAYDCFMQEPHHAADQFGKLQGDSSNFPEWVASTVLLLTPRFPSRILPLSLMDNHLRRIGKSHTSLTHQSPTILHSASVSFPHARRQRNFLTLSKGDAARAVVFTSSKLFVIINASQQGSEQAWELSPFVYHLSDLPEAPIHYSRPFSPYNPRPSLSLGEVRRPPNHLVDKFCASCFHCGRAGHWCAYCPHTRGVANPNPRPPSPMPFRPMRPATPDCHSQQGPGMHYHIEHVSKVQFMEQDASHKVLIDLDGCPGFLVTTTFDNHCWWLDVLAEEGTKSLSLHEWNERLGHACDKMVISFLEQHVPAFDTKCWKPFYCEVCATAKSTHWLARARTDILKPDPLDLLVSDIMDPFAGDTQGFCYLLTVRDHVSTYSVVYPLKAHSDDPDAVLDAIWQLQVWLCLTPKAL